MGHSNMGFADSLAAPIKGQPRPSTKFNLMKQNHLTRYIGVFQFSLYQAVLVRSFSKYMFLSRPWKVWTELASSKGFAPEEVLQATAQGPYVVVDPDEPHTLLALSPTAFQKLKGQCVSSERSLVLLFSPLDDRVAPASASDGNHSQSPPLWGQFEGYLGLHGSKNKIKASSAFRLRWFCGIYNPAWNFVSGRLVIDLSSRLYRQILQRWYSIITFWMRQSHMRSDGVSLYHFTTFLYRIGKKNGLVFMCQYMKTSLFVVQRFIAGDKLHHTHKIKPFIRLRNGLPVWLPEP